MLPSWCHRPGVLREPQLRMYRNAGGNPFTKVWLLGLEWLCGEIDMLPLLPLALAAGCHDGAQAL